MAVVEVAVVPRSASDRVVPYAENVLRVGVVRPPAGDEANRAVIQLAARALEVAPSSVRLLAGGRARRGQLGIEGFDHGELDRRLWSLPLD